MMNVGTSARFWTVFRLITGKKADTENRRKANKNKAKSDILHKLSKNILGILHKTIDKRGEVWYYTHTLRRTI